MKRLLKAGDVDDDYDKALRWCKIETTQDFVVCAIIISDSGAPPLRDCQVDSLVDHLFNIFHVFFYPLSLIKRCDHGCCTNLFLLCPPKRFLYCYEWITNSIATE